MGKIEFNARLSRLIFEAMNKRDFSDLDPYLADDVCLDFPGVQLVKTNRKFQIFMKALLRSYQELEFTITEIISSESSSCVVWKNMGRDSGNSLYSNRGMTLVHFRDDKIVFVSDYFKDTSFVE